MKKYVFLVGIIGFVFFISCNQSTDSGYQTEKQTDKNGYAYESVKGDLLNARIYTLANGLKVFMTQNKKEPRVQVLIAVKAGSTYDPKETTGLAHYLEHMMFKGSSKFGTTDWNEEKKQIDKISELYEEYRKTENPKQKKIIYAKIDSVSAIAANYAIANEYDKMTAMIGAKGTNAYTSEERTVYINDIPSNELEKYIEIEKERFSSLVLRLFHTELETVYEEFNMGQDDDNNKLWETLYAELYKKHPYGTQTVIGKAEHLKNPSMINIHNYWNTYYVPNNMAIAMSGDIDFEKTIQIIDKNFGALPKKDVPKFIPPVEDEIAAPIEKTVLGPNPENMVLAWRLSGVKSEDAKAASIVNALLSNGKAGLIDLNLIQKQKILSGWSYFSKHRDYCEMIIGGTPREGQTLEDLQKLFLDEIEKIKRGEFDDWMLEAVINNMKLQKIKSQESNWRAHEYVEAFSYDAEWKDYVKFLDDLGKITKKDIVDFAKKNFGKNYVTVYKKIGKDTNIVKVEKPQITPVKINRDASSAFMREFKNKKSERLTPVFPDFEREISLAKLTSGIELNYIKNVENELFTLYYVFDMGKNHNTKLPLAFNLVKYLGTTKYSAEDLQKELFRYGLKLNTFASNERTYISLSGLKKSFEKGVELLEHIIMNLKPEQKVYDEYVAGILKERADNKLDKDVILWSAMYDYGKFGAHSPFTNILSEKELKEIKPNTLTNLVKDVFNYKHRIFYYGQDPSETVAGILEKYHKPVKSLIDYPEPIAFTEADTKENQVLFVDYDMVQANIIIMTKDVPFTKEIIPVAELFNEYYGGNMSSIVFQEIREARGLAYSAYGYYDMPDRLGKSNYTIGFVATQADKLAIATDAMLALMNEMPRSDKSFDMAVESIMKRIESERINGSQLFWSYQSNLDRGILYDSRKDVYTKMKTARYEHLQEFFNTRVKGKKYTFLVLGNKKLLNFKTLEKIGKVKELTLKEVFNY